MASDHKHAIVSRGAGTTLLDPRSPHDIAFFCRQYLSFKDLCATRRVCKSWTVIDTYPIEYTVFVCEDGDFACLPNREDQCFRRCLLAANLRDVNIEIADIRDLVFLREMLPSLRRLSMEIEIPFHHTERIKWTRDMLSNASNLEKLEMQVYGFDTTIEVDFLQLPRLSYFHSNVQVQLLNYDQRPMNFFGYVVDYWDGMCSVIAYNSRKLRVCRYETISSAYYTFLLNWRQPNTNRKPLYIECTASGTHFCTCLQGSQLCILFPAFHLDQFQGIYEGSYEDYANFFTHTLKHNPSTQFLFHETCTEHEKNWWKNIINPIRKNFGLISLS